MDGSQAIAAGAARSAFSVDAQHDRLLRLHFPRDDGPGAILLPNRLSATRKSRAASASRPNSCRTTRKFP